MDGSSVVVVVVAVFLCVVRYGIVGRKQNGSKVIIDFGPGTFAAAGGNFLSGEMKRIHRVYYCKLNRKGTAALVSSKSIKKEWKKQLPQYFYPLSCKDITTYVAPHFC